MHVRSGDIDIFYYTTLEKTNIITKKLENYKAVISLSSKESSIDIKVFKNNILHVGKELKLKKIQEINNINDVISTYTLSNRLVSY